MKIKLTDPELLECLEAFNTLNPEERISMSAYDLADMTNITDYSRWITFLKHPAVAEKIDEEFNLYIEAQKRKLVQTSTVDDKSVGKAQLISALAKSATESSGGNGNLFIYTYVPLNHYEAKRPHDECNYDIMDTD